MGSFKLPAGYRVKDRHQLSSSDADFWKNVKDIKQSAYDKLVAAQQRYLDSDRILEGRMTEIKWERGWQDGAYITFNEETGEVLNLEGANE